MLDIKITAAIESASSVGTRRSSEYDIAIGCVSRSSAPPPLLYTCFLVLFINISYCMLQQNILLCWMYMWMLISSTFSVLNPRPFLCNWTEWVSWWLDIETRNISYFFRFHNEARIYFAISMSIFNSFSFRTEIVSYSFQIDQVSLDYVWSFFFKYTPIPQTSQRCWKNMRFNAVILITTWTENSYLNIQLARSWISDFYHLCPAFAFLSIFVHKHTV